jgi:hypothetical protein
VLDTIATNGSQGCYILLFVLLQWCSRNSTIDLCFFAANVLRFCIIVICFCYNRSVVSLIRGTSSETFYYNSTNLFAIVVVWFCYNSKNDLLRELKVTFGRQAHFYSLFSNSSKKYYFNPYIPLTSPYCTCVILSPTLGNQRCRKPMMMAFKNAYR